MKGISPLVRRYVEWLSRHAGAVLLSSVAIASVAALSLLRLEFDIGLVSMLPAGSSRFEDYERFVERFGTRDLVVALVRAPDGDAAKEFASTLAREFEREPEILEVQARVDHQAFLRALTAGALPRLLPLDRYDELSARLETKNIEQGVAGMKRALALPGMVGVTPALTSDPLGFSLVLSDALAAARPDRSLTPGAEILSSQDGRRVLLLVRPAHAGYGLEQVESLAEALERAEQRTRDRLGVRGGLSVGYTGAFAHALEDSHLLRRDIRLYLILALIGVLVVFYIGYRDLRILPFVTYHLSLTTLVALALGIVLLGRLNLLSLAFAAIFYGLGVDGAIHFYTRFLEEKSTSRDPLEAVARTMTALFWPTLLAAVTTAIAFGVIGLSSLRGVSQLGLLTAIGLLLNLPSTFGVMAALILWLERRQVLARSRRPTRAIWLAAVAGFVARHRKKSVLVLAGLLGLATIGARQTSIDTDLFHLRPSESEAMGVEAEIQREFGFTNPQGSVLVETTRVGDPTAIDGVLQVTERVTARLRSELATGRVLSVTSPSPLLPSQATQQARLDAWAELPREAAAETLTTALEEAGFRVEAFGEALRFLRRVPAPTQALSAPLPGLEILVDRQVERDEHALSVLVSFTPADTVALEEVAEKLTESVEVPPGVSFLVTGRPLMEAELGRTARRELVGFVVVVLVILGALVGLRERRWAPTFALLGVPVLSVTFLLGLVGALGVPLTPVSLVVFPLVIGIGLDDCLFLAERYRETGEISEAVARGGRALSITTATTVTGFGALALSEYPALSGLGSLAALGLLVCFFATIVWLPALLSPRWLRAVRSAGSAAVR